MCGVLLDVREMTFKKELKREEELIILFFFFTVWKFQMMANN